MKQILLILVLALVAIGVYADDANAQFWAADQSLLIMPTAYTMPKGMHSLTDIEVLFLQYGYAVTGRTHLSAGMAFPVTKDMVKTFSAGFKSNFLQTGKLQSAAFGTYNPDTRLLMGGIVNSYGNPKSSAHLLTALLYNSKKGEFQTVLGLGGITSFSSRISGIAEFYHIPTTLGNILDDGGDHDLEFYGMMGIRFKGHKMSWDIGAFRGLGVDMGDLIALPVLKATFLF